MKKQTLVLLSAACLLTVSAGAQNLLLNGDFNLPGDGSSASDWTAWAWGGGWANTEIPGWSFDGSYQLSAGASGNGGGGTYQIVSATAGLTYSLSVESGADAWWLPTGTMTMFFLDASAAEIDSATRTTVDPAVYGPQYGYPTNPNAANDKPHPWQNFSLIATAPAGTTQIKVEFASNDSAASPGTATGSVGFDNAILTVQSVPEPGITMLSLLGGTLLLIGRRCCRSAVRA